MCVGIIILNPLRPSNVDTAGSDPLPILKRLQARKEHLEELRGELRSFSFPNGDEAPTQTVTSSASETKTQLTSSSSDVPLSSGVSIKVSFLLGQSNVSSI